MAKKRSKKHTDLAGGMPFPGRDPVMKGEPETHLKGGKIKHKKTATHMNSTVRTGLVKGPLKVSGKHGKPKRTTVKA